MINTDMRLYDYYTYDSADEYGQLKLSTDVQGQIKMSINVFSQSILDNINYQYAQYVGLTQSKIIDDTFVIQYGDKKLKVLYFTPKGRFKQVFLTEV